MLVKNGDDHTMGKKSNNSPTQQIQVWDLLIDPLPWKMVEFHKTNFLLEKNPWILQDGREPTFTYLYPPETNLRNPTFRI